MPSTSLALDDPAAARPRCDAPIFVLCNARSGSTLLRFLLDAHPEIACPPETNLPALCAQLATVWSLIEGAPLSANRGDEPPDIPDAAIAGIRETMDRMVGSYLARHGKTRYCDKSLGTARFAELLLRVYPKARFICVFRHPMDVIASGMEACPWGLNGYGFDAYAATTPGNSVLALARFWADNAATTLAAAEQFPDQSLRVRYEDLVTEPEETAAGIFRFLGVAPAPGISTACFSAERERYGPGDYKIWFTSAVSADSMGRGWSIPAGMIGPQVLGVINELAGKLGYQPIDEQWGTTAPPTSLCRPADGADGTAPAEAVSGTRSEPAGSARAADSAGAATGPGAAEAAPRHSAALGARLDDALSGLSPEAGGRWGRQGSETMIAISVPGDPRQATEHWLVDLGTRSVSFVDRAAQEKSDWDVIGAADAWAKLMTGELNLSVALRSCQLRYCEGRESDSPVAADARIGILADLLSLAHW